MSNDSAYIGRNVIRVIAVLLITSGVAVATNPMLGLGVGLFLTQIRLD